MSAMDLPPQAGFWLPPRPAIIRPGPASGQADQASTGLLLAMARRRRAAAGGGCDCTPAYDSGDRTSAITVTSGLAWAEGTYGALSQLVDGNTGSGTGIPWDGSQDIADVSVLRFDFGAPVLITGTKFYWSGSNGVGTVVFRGSDNASDWTTLGTTQDWDPPSANPFEDTSMSGNTAGYRYYEYTGVVGTTPTTGRMFHNEFEFNRCTC